jgi:hypothetical protein
VHGLTIFYDGLKKSFGSFDDDGIRNIADVFLDDEDDERFICLGLTYFEFILLLMKIDLFSFFRSILYY